MPVPPSLFTEPPTPDTLHHAKLHLESTRSLILSLNDKIVSAELALVQLIHETKASIAKMTEEKSRLEADEAMTKSYLSPVRRLPAELLREIFLLHFQEHEACAWVLAAVCAPWRRLALRTPKLWAKVSALHPRCFLSTGRLSLNCYHNGLPLTSLELCCSCNGQAMGSTGDCAFHYSLRASRAFYSVFIFHLLFLTFRTHGNDISTDPVDHYTNVLAGTYQVMARALWPQCPFGHRNISSRGRIPSNMPRYVLKPSFHGRPETTRTKVIRIWWKHHGYFMVKFCVT
jgi:hypothetical protein